MILVRSTLALLGFLILGLLNLIETAAGLPNTCSRCGQPIVGTWYAPNIDAARSGQGRCGACAGVVPETPKSAGAADTPPDGLLGSSAATVGPDSLAIMAPPDEAAPPVKRPGK